VDAEGAVRAGIPCGDGARLRVEGDDVHAPRRAGTGKRRLLSRYEHPAIGGPDLTEVTAHVYQPILQLAGGAAPVRICVKFRLAVAGHEVDADQIGRYDSVRAPEVATEVRPRRAECHVQNPADLGRLLRVRAHDVRIPGQSRSVRRPDRPGTLPRDVVHEPEPSPDVERRVVSGEPEREDDRRAVRRA